MAAFISSIFTSSFLQSSSPVLKSSSGTTCSLPPGQRSKIVSVLAPSTSAVQQWKAGPITTMGQFWELADDSKLMSQYDADKKIAFLKDASLEEVRRICLQYRYFVEKYPDNLAMLISKMAKGELKSLLCDILSEEMGMGDVNASHSTWYDSFLRSLGVSEYQLKHSLYAENESILKETERRCREELAVHCIGLVGMGRECLCQIYLSQMYKNLRQNAEVVKIEEQIDWLFWDFHTGDDDVEHRMKMRERIGALVMDENGVRQLTDGYRFAKSSWDEFWENNYTNTRFFRN